jgi:hypothetical protein
LLMLFGDGMLSGVESGHGAGEAELVGCGCHE